jgi:hypothetical protein
LCEHFSKLTEAQRQSLAVISQQVDGARQTDEQIGKSLTAFQEAVTTLGHSCAESTESLRQLRTDHAIRDEHLSGMVEQQSKRFLLLFIVTLVLAVSGVVATILGAIR